MDSFNDKKRSLLIFSPVAIIGAGYLTVRLTGAFLGIWAWLPLALVLWGMFTLMIFWSGGRENIRTWLGMAKGSIGWPILALAISLIPLSLFLHNWNLFTSNLLILAWLIFALINAPLEEFYWRGVLTDSTVKWPGWLSILYSSFFFAINHPLTYGIYSLGNRHPITVVSTFVMGIVWATTYRKTGSLRWAIAAHFLVDLFNLSILTFLNIYVPPSLPGM
jgi:membrane protease YdiL (CAAX protease family)